MATSTAVRSYEDYVKEQLEASKRMTQGADRKYISTKGKMFTLPSGTSDKGPLRVVVLGFTNVNTFFEGDYDPSKHQSPACFAINRFPEELKPDTDAPKPQNEDCATCPQNKFGSKGKGKACRNKVRLALVQPEDVSEDSTIFLLDTSPTAVKTWGSYVDTLREAHSAIVQQKITDIKFHPDHAYGTLIFEPAGDNPIKPAVMQALIARANQLLDG